MLEGIFFVIIVCLLFYIKDIKNREDPRIRELQEKTWSLEVAVEEERMNKADSENHAKISRQFLEDERHSKCVEQELIETQEKLEEETKQRKKVFIAKKSSEVRLGHIAETLAPFLDQFDFEPERCSFLGQPIDYVSFGDDEITFIEVKKSGNSQLSQKQKHIKHLVEQKLISWKEIRIK